MKKKLFLNFQDSPKIIALFLSIKGILQILKNKNNNFILK